jgi:hypothetical protein|tara:strand:- start:765 stop:1028 length:264 start_codon:yes stop_codon:yes gene_type:complete
MAEKVYLKCSAKKKIFDNGGSILNIGIKAETLTAFIAEHTNERGYLNLTVQERREVGQYGDTHSVTLDTWEPAAPKVRPLEPSDIPF